MNHLKIEVPEGKSLHEGSITLNGQELTRVVKLSVAAYPHMPMPIVNIALRAEIVEVVNAEVVIEEEDPPAAYVPLDVAEKITGEHIPAFEGDEEESYD